jgi:hypothetical protein
MLGFTGHGVVTGQVEPLVVGGLWHLLGVVVGVDFVEVLVEVLSGLVVVPVVVAASTGVATNVIDAVTKTLATTCLCKKYFFIVISFGVLVRYGVRFITERLGSRLHVSVVLVDCRVDRLHVTIQGLVAGA